MAPLRSQLPALYGAIANGIWAEQSQYLVTWNVPAELIPNFHYQGAKVTHIMMHKDMVDALNQVMANVVSQGIQSTLKSFDGCWMIRNTRGEDKISVHAWGLAIDLNASTNQLSTVGDIDPQLVQCFKDAGFVWGGDFHRKDPMHFQYCIEA